MKKKKKKLENCVPKGKSFICENVLVHECTCVGVCIYKICACVVHTRVIDRNGNTGPRLAGSQQTFSQLQGAHNHIFANSLFSEDLLFLTVYAITIISLSLLYPLSLWIQTSASYCIHALYTFGRKFPEYLWDLWARTKSLGIYCVYTIAIYVWELNWICTGSKLSSNEK